MKRKQPSSTGFEHIRFIEDHGDKSIGNLLSIHRHRSLSDKGRILSLIRALASGANDLEENLFDLQVNRTLDNSIGPDLDQWGLLVGEIRGGLPDRAYRNFIKARVLALTSEGNADRLIEIFDIITDAEEVKYIPCYPAGFALVAYIAEPLEENIRRRIRRTMALAKPGGVEMVLIEATIEPFTLDDETRGFDTGEFSRII